MCHDGQGGTVPRRRGGFTSTASPTLQNRGFEPMGLMKDDDGGAGIMAEAGLEANRINRRAAMKTAAAAAAAAAVWSAPRVEGLSFVPDYAAAASCAVPSDSRAATKNATTKACNLAGVISRKICWGNATGSPAIPTINTGVATCGSATISFPSLPNPNGGAVGLSASVGGDVYNGNSNTAVQSANSRISGLALTGMGPTVGSCTLDVTGACSTGAFRAGANANSLGSSSSEVRTANGSFSDVWVKCVGTFNSGQNAAFTLTLTCNFNC